MNKNTTKTLLSTVHLFDVPIFSGSKEELLNRLEGVIFTPNPEFLVEAERDSEFKKILQSADINIPDGVGLIWSSRLLGKPIKERIAGADVVEELLERGSRESWVIGVSGARRGNLDEAALLFEKLEEKFPNVKFVNLDSPNFKFEILNFKSKDTKFSINQFENCRRNDKARDTCGTCDTRGTPRFDLVLSCWGMKLQEKWIVENKDKIDADIFMGIGGSLDFLTGYTKRAPMLIRKIGFEWLWRGIQRPKHFKRVYKAVVEFGVMVVKERLNSKIKM